MNAEQRVAILTGAANGIGWALAQKFAQAGYAVCLFDLDGDAAKKRARELPEIMRVLAAMSPMKAGRSRLCSRRREIWQARCPCQ